MNVRPSIVLSRPTATPLVPEILLLRYRYGQEDVYALPGGNPDKGETLPETIIRELREELGIMVAVDIMIFCGEVILNEVKNDVLHTVFEGTITTGTPELNPVETTALEIVWKSVDQLKGLNLYPNLGAEIYRWFAFDTVEPGYIGRIKQRYF